MQSSFCTRALGVLSQIGRHMTSSCCRLVDQGVKGPFSEISESSGVFSEQLSELEIPFSEYEIPFSEWPLTT